MIRRLAALALWFACLTAARPAPGIFDRSTPEMQGVSSAAILSFVEAADKIDAMNRSIDRRDCGKAAKKNTLALPG